MFRLKEIFTHKNGCVSHTHLLLSKASDLRFYSFSTVFTCGYYYYLYIYKIHFQADRFQIRVRLLHTYMSARATA